MCARYDVPNPLNLVSAEAASGDPMLNMLLRPPSLHGPTVTLATSRGRKNRLTYGVHLMQFKKSAFIAIAIATSLILGCDSGKKVELEAGSKITATLWSVSDTLFGKDLAVQTGMRGIEQYDVPTQNALKKMNCNLAVEPKWDAPLSRFVAGTAKLACDNDTVEIPAVLIDEEGKAGIPTLALDQRITVRLTDSTKITIK